MAARPKRLVVGNWKMYIESLETARSLAASLKRKEKSVPDIAIWVAPPAPFVPVLAGALHASPIKVGAQAVSPFGGGTSTELSASAHTGDVSVKMIRSVGATFSIVGHSERRAAGESDSAINEELKSILAASMYAILCVGERERDDHGGHLEFIAGQLRSALADVPKPALAKLVIAYEPIWAIGKSASDAARPETVRETVIFIRKTLVELMERAAALRLPILYGGSVESENAAALIDGADIGGFLVGHASADANTFLKIIAVCSVRPENKRRKNSKSKIRNSKQIRNRKSQKSKPRPKRAVKKKKR